MNEKEEQSYEQGSHQAWLLMLQRCLQELGRDSEAWNKSRWVMERESAILTLRRVCDKFGDNGWPDDLHLSDIIEKHLERYLQNK